MKKMKHSQICLIHIKYSTKVGCFAYRSKIASRVAVKREWLCMLKEKNKIKRTHYTGKRRQKQFPDNFK